MLTQIQSQKQQFKILPQQIHLLNFFFLNSLELQQRIKNELEENPFLDAREERTEDGDTKLNKDDIQDFESSEEHMYDDRPDYKMEYQNYFDGEANINTPIVSVTTFKEDAKQQLHLLELSNEDSVIAEYIIDALTPRGLADKTMDEMTDDISFHFHRVIDSEKVSKCLAIVQSLDPVGLGAGSIREYLLIQLRGMDENKSHVKCAIVLLEHHYTELMQRRFEKISHTLKIKEAQLKSVLGLIGTLQFYPVSEENQSDARQTIIPDFLITNHADDVQVSLCSSKAGSVFVNPVLYNQLADNAGNSKTTDQYIKSKLSGAQWFVDAVRQRENTMLRIMRCIAALQHEYFMTGDIKDLKPMVLRHVAERTGTDISVVSRITGNKYASTPFGLIFLKKLFSEGIADDRGEVISNKVIKSMLGDTIESENKKQPYTDQQLASLLSLKGVNIARRTVAKYRMMMHVPIAQIRAVWA